MIMLPELFPALLRRIDDLDVIEPGCQELRAVLLNVGYIVLPCHAAHRILKRLVDKEDVRQHERSTGLEYAPGFAHEILPCIEVKCSFNTDDVIKRLIVKIEVTSIHH